MQLEVGSVVEGKVTGITKFGAFVELPDGKTGMVHISEVAPTYVKEIRDFVTENQTVKVKILSIGDDGKVSLSMKKALPPAPRGPRPRAVSPGRPGGFEWQSSRNTSRQLRGYDVQVQAGQRRKDVRPETFGGRQARRRRIFPPRRFPVKMMIRGDYSPVVLCRTMLLSPYVD